MRLACGRKKLEPTAGYVLLMLPFTPFGKKPPLTTPVCGVVVEGVETP